MSTSRRAGRLPALDGLRGVAALIVVLHHALLPVPQIADPLYDEGGAGRWAWLEYTPLHVLTAGEEAVVVFFVLSGFVLTRPVLAGGFRWLPYYGSRLVRLYLPAAGGVLWALLVVAVLPRHGLVADPSPWMRDHGLPLHPWTPLTDFLLVEQPSDLNGPLWSLRWEVLFSVLLPLYVALAVRVRRFWLPLIGLVALGEFAVVAAGHWTGQYLPTFLVGVLLAARLDAVDGLGRRIEASRHRRVLWGLLVAAAVLLITARWTLGRVLPAPLQAAYIPLVLIGAALWLFIALQSPTAARFLTWRPVHRLGVLSFSLYLVHEPVAIGVGQLLPLPARPLGFLIVVPVSLLVAWGFSRAVERPAHRASQWVRRRLSGTGGAGSAPRPLPGTGA